MSLFNSFKEYTLYSIALLFFVSFASFAQVKTLSSSNQEVIFPKNPNIGIATIPNDSHQYVFEVEYFPVFCSQMESFNKHLEKVFALEDIST